MSATAEFTPDQLAQVRAIFAERDEALAAIESEKERITELARKLNAIAGPRLFEHKGEMLSGIVRFKKDSPKDADGKPTVTEAFFRNRTVAVPTTVD